FGGAHQNLLIPRDQENRASVHRLGEHGGIRRARKTWQHDVGATNSADHRAVRVDPRVLAQAVGPWTGSIDDPAGFDPLLSPGQQIAEQQSLSTPVGNVYSEHLGIVSYECTGGRGLHEPF